MIIFDNKSTGLFNDTFSVYLTLYACLVIIYTHVLRFGVKLNLTSIAKIYHIIH